MRAQAPSWARRGLIIPVDEKKRPPSAITTPPLFFHLPVLLLSRTHTPPPTATRFFSIVLVQCGHIRHVRRSRSHSRGVCFARACRGTFAVVNSHLSRARGNRYVILCTCAVLTYYGPVGRSTRFRHRGFDCSMSSHGLPRRSVWYCHLSTSDHD